MDCDRVVFSGHAVRRMFERGIGRDDVLGVVAGGRAIMEYGDDKPYPSRLLLGFSSGRPLHVVMAFDQAAGTCIVVTVYEPSAQRWGEKLQSRTRQ